MSEESKYNDGSADVIAMIAVIIIIVGTMVYWLAHQ